jgi:hypothetical protein
VTSWIGAARAFVVRALMTTGCALASAGCAGPPLPAEPQALETELRTRSDALRAALATFQAEGTVAIDGPDRVKLNWRADAVRGRWARVAVSSSVATDPVVEVRAGGADRFSVRVSPPGAPAALYRTADDLENLPADSPLREAAEWLMRLARDEGSAMPSVSRIGPSGDVVRVELAGDVAARAQSGRPGLAMTLRRSDGMPLEVEAPLPGAGAGVCLLVRASGNRRLSVPGTPLSLSAEIDAALRACCSPKTLASVRFTIARVRTDPPSALPRWSDTARPIGTLRDDRWIRRTLRDAQAVRDAAAQACDARGGRGHD